MKNIKSKIFSFAIVLFLVLSSGSLNVLTAQARVYDGPCTFEQIPGRTIVNLTPYKVLLSYGTDPALATGGPFSTTLVAGTYDVTFQSYDNHTEKVQVQPEEQWYLILKDAGDNTVATTSAISDLPDDIDFMEEVVDTNFVLTSAVTSATTYHDAFPAGVEPNSISPVCAAFDLVPPPTATIEVTKIVCPTEDLLPNWGAGGADITSTTASDFIIANPTCHTEEWTFEWAPNGTSNPGDQTGVAGGDWTAFTSSATVSTGALIWVREQFNNDYVPFSGDTTAPQDENVSAEFYCSNDVLNYDNYDFIDPVEASQTYYCVGFNAPISQSENSAPTADAGPDQIITLPTNSTSLNGTGTDTDGTIATYVWTQVSGPVLDPNDVEDPAISGLVAGTYVFKLTVTDNDGATGEDTVTITVNSEVENPQCSDNIDNSDSEDTLADELDPGCHTDGDANNLDSYNADDNDETDEGGGGDTSTQCSDGVDNSDAEDTLADELDPGCHSDGNVNNTSSYVPSDNDETDVPQCSNTGDDDNDQLIDALDPGCHSDGNVDNPDSYVPLDNDETNSVTQCSDGLDNDDDQFIDSLDPGCHSDENTGNPDSYVPSDNDESNGGGGGGSSGSRRKSTGQVLGAQTSCGIYVDKYLRRGYDNNVETVKKVQQFLNDYMQLRLEVDGMYGLKTEEAVRAFQIRQAGKVLSPWGIAASTGIFYLTTQTEVNNIMCPDLNLPIPSNLVNFTPSVIN